MQFLGPETTTAKRIIVNEEIANAPQQILYSNVQVSNTGNTTENTVFTGTIPANSIGVNGSFWILALFSMTNNANTKTARFKFNGTLIWNIALANFAAYSSFHRINNRNSASSQVTAGQASSLSAYGFGGSSVALQTFSFNTAADITFTITLQNVSSSSDASALESMQLLAL